MFNVSSPLLFITIFSANSGDEIAVFEHSSYLEAIVSGFYPHFVHSSFSALFSLVKKINLSSIVKYDILKIDVAPNLKQIFKKVTFFMRQSITYHFGLTVTVCITFCCSTNI